MDSYAYNTWQRVVLVFMVPITALQYLEDAYGQLCLQYKAAPPAPVADMHWQQHHVIAPAPEAETPLPAARPEAIPKEATAAVEEKDFFLSFSARTPLAAAIPKKGVATFPRACTNELSDDVAERWPVDQVLCLCRSRSQDCQ